MRRLIKITPLIYCRQCRKIPKIGNNEKTIDSSQVF